MLILSFLTWRSSLSWVLSGPCWAPYRPHPRSLLSSEWPYPLTLHCRDYKLKISEIKIKLKCHTSTLSRIFDFSDNISQLQKHITCHFIDCNLSSKLAFISWSCFMSISKDFSLVLILSNMGPVTRILCLDRLVSKQAWLWTLSITPLEFFMALLNISISSSMSMAGMLC